MLRTYNIYCDESGRQEHDEVSVIVLGALWCPLEKAAEIALRLREIKARHGLSPAFEVKWTKVSPAKQAFYLDPLDYFFDEAQKADAVPQGAASLLLLRVVDELLSVSTSPA